jgi:DNA-binding LytR/AlgR family response regulator
MISALIAEDEPLLAQELQVMLAEIWPELRIIACARDGASALQMIEQHKPTVVFLDVQMPRLTGLEVAERVQGETHVVFVTAYDQHAISAFEQGAVDYLLKPVKTARLAATVQRLQQRLGKAGTAQHPLKWIQATLGNTLRFIAVDDVFYCRSEDKYTKVITGRHEALIRRSLSSLQEINRGIIVNVEHIETVTRLETGEMLVNLRGLPVQLPVSKPHQSLFRGM